MASKAEMLNMVVNTVIPESITAKVIWDGETMPLTFKRDIFAYGDLCSEMMGNKVPFEQMKQFMIATINPEDGELLVAMLQKFPVETCGAVFPQLLPMYDSGGKITGIDLLKKAEEPVPEIS